MSITKATMIARTMIPPIIVWVAVNILSSPLLYISKKYNPV